MHNKYNSKQIQRAQYNLYYFCFIILTSKLLVEAKIHLGAGKA